ncbi:MAG: hypothetical protein ACE14T_10100 [Syntrophales bacterium]
MAGQDKPKDRIEVGGVDMDLSTAWKIISDQFEMLKGWCPAAFLNEFETKIKTYGLMVFAEGMKVGIQKDRQRMKEIYDSVEEFIPFADAIQDFLLKTAKIDGNA